jgi:hypothetical protein
LSQLLQPLPAPWWIAGGWAIDLFIGGQSRQHLDTDVQILRRDQLAFKQVFAKWDLYAAAEGVLRSWTGDRPEEGTNSIWCRLSPAAPWALEVLLADADDDQWVFRRNRAIRRPIEAVGRRNREGVPFVAPEVQLLFKAKEPRPADEADMDIALPLLDGPSKAWLRQAIELTHPGHPWIEHLNVR